VECHLTSFDFFNWLLWCCVVFTQRELDPPLQGLGLWWCLPRLRVVQPLLRMVRLLLLVQLLEHRLLPDLWGLQIVQQGLILWFR